MKAISRAGKIIFASLIFIMAIFIGNEKVFAATTVTDFNGLKQAIETGTDDINVQGTINVTETLTIRRDVKISGGGLKASNLATAEPEIGNIFYVEEGKNFELENITLDGDKKARIIYSNGGILKITNSTIKNGFPGANAKVNPGGGIFLRGGSLTATNTDFIGNTPGTNDTLSQGDGDKNGGAIYSGSTKADITITGGKFENNEVKAYGHGAGIYQENGTLNVTGTSFKNNKGHVEGGNAGTQGVCIHTRDKVTATISGVTAEIAKGFNTGGFLRSWGSDVTVTDSKFTIKDLGDGYGYSGGALCFENGTSKVTGSTFTCNGSKLYHAGGFIDIVGTGTHVIDNNKMTGAGMDEHKFKAIASFGGAISVEEGTSATVTITNNTITDTSASDTGGAIAIGTHKSKSTPSTVTMSGNTITNPGTYYFGGQYGGGVFVGPDATVTMSKDTIKNAKSSYGGGVYNEGKLTISGGSSLTGGVGSKLGGEIYNNGDLIVDDATITGSFVGGAAWQQYASHGKNYELGGTNIYAEEDVTITPKANITTGKDVRVLDGQSKILLTGALTKEIDVSISEIAGGSEKPNRRVGYVIAEGKGGYVATKSDAKFLHYIGRTNKEDARHYSNQPRAAFADDKSTGEWDFVLDKDNKKVVLGQRVKLIYHGNLGKLGENDKEEKTVDVYKNPNFWENQLEEYKVADPTLDGSSFMGWYFWKSGDSVEDTDDSIQNIKIPDDLREDLFDFSRVKFENNVKDTDKIITPNVINTYAGWSQNISIPVFKEWVDAKDDDKTDVTVTLKGGDEEKTLTLTKAGNYFDQFEDLKVFTKSYEPNKEKNMNLKFTPREYKVEETPIDGFTTSYSPQSMKANEVAEVSRFVVTNKKTFKVTYEFKSGTEGKTLPAEIEGYKPTDDAEYADGATVNAKEPTQTSYEAEDGTWTFTKWDANSKTIDGSDVKFIGTWTFTPKAPEPETKYKVTYEFVSGTEGKTLPAEVEGYKPTDDAEYADGATVNAKEPTETSYEAEDGTWTFTKWDANSKTIDGADIKFVGTWTFTPKEKPNPDKPKPPVTNIITEYVDIYGNELIPSKDGDQPVEVIPGYEFIETRRTEKVVSHIYKKIEREDPDPWFPLFPRVERKEKVETISVNAVVPEKTLLNKEDHKAYMFGYPDWTFLPNNNMTRAEVTAMFARLLKNYPSTNVKYNLPYSDVFEGDWYYPAVGFMTENNIIKGYEDGTFRPNAPITRAEFATIASKFDEIIGGDVKGFYDVPASHWALKYINSAYERGWVTGYEDGSFRPDRNITRAEVVTVTNKMLIRYADVDYVRANRDLLINFKDLDESHWAYFNIMEATHGHDFMRKANGKDETWERLNGEAFIFPDLRYEER